MAGDACVRADGPTAWRKGFTVLDRRPGRSFMATKSRVNRGSSKRCTEKGNSVWSSFDSLRLQSNPLEDARRPRARKWCPHKATTHIWPESMKLPTLEANERTAREMEWCKIRATKRKGKGETRQEQAIATPEARGRPASRVRTIRQCKSRSARLQEPDPPGHHEQREHPECIAETVCDGRARRGLSRVEAVLLLRSGFQVLRIGLVDARQDGAGRVPLAQMVALDVAFAGLGVTGLMVGLRASRRGRLRGAALQHQSFGGTVVAHPV